MIAYRRALTESPSYTLNHEEVHKALEEGIVFAEGLTPRSVEIDEHGSARALRSESARCERRVGRCRRNAAACAHDPRGRRHSAQHGACARRAGTPHGMMKEICAQCLQPHVDPATGETRYVFSCFNQDQPLDQVDWRALNARLKQNGVQEKLTSAWISHCLRETPA